MTPNVCQYHLGQGIRGWNNFALQIQSLPTFTLANVEVLGNFLR